jgi:hypothetical protein
MACLSRGLHGDIRLYIRCGMVSLHPNVVERPYVRLLDGAKVGNVGLVHHFDTGSI